MDKIYIFQHFFCCIFFCFGMLSCSENKVPTPEKEYLRHVGDIEYNPLIDGDENHLCNSDNFTMQYFNLLKGFTYNGEKTTLVRAFNSKYKAVDSHDSGLIRIRFIVNCLGETGRFRLLQMDESYKKNEFDNEITDQLVSITKELTGWEILSHNHQARDYYQHLIFKIKDGQLLEIMP